MTEIDDNRELVHLSGELDAETVPRRLRESENWFERGEETVIDLSGVTRADSAGVALLLEWVRDAQTNQASLSFVNAPAQMRAIIDFCALNDVIRLRERAA
ncbi:STAS domain-containing protein [Salinisphaera aquimarina]|uniref:Lipid asymmetry maintenance protein MlaB n=1 Tax=Salinisphaera aquimarina TaxID=2094031 RepID=A0ABV7EQE6_9GAMM